MSEIQEAVARALAQKDAEDEGLKFPTSPMAYRAYMGLARAAIQAYEAAKMRDLLAGMLTHEISADGVVNYVERDKMLEKSRQTNKWMSDAINRLAERKP